MREPIGVDQRLLVTLRYLATGDARSTIAADYRMSPTTVERIINETCNALWNRLIKIPSITSAWKQIARD